MFPARRALEGPARARTRTPEEAKRRHAYVIKYVAYAGKPCQGQRRPSGPKDAGFCSLHTVLKNPRPAKQAEMVPT